MSTLVSLLVYYLSLLTTPLLLSLKECERQREGERKKERKNGGRKDIKRKREGRKERERGGKE